MPRLTARAAFEDLAAICKQGRFEEAITRLVFLCQQGVSVPQHIVNLLLENCLRKKDLPTATQLKDFLAQGELNSLASVLSDNLIRLFASCNCLQQANEIFESVPKPTIYTWNAIISAHSKLNADWNALLLYEKMQQTGLDPDKFTLLPMLRSCSTTTVIDKGRLLHDRIIRSSIESDGSIRNALIDMYMKCGNLSEGRKIFESPPHLDLVSWGAMISGCTQHGCGTMALEYFERMLDGFVPNRVIYSCVLTACGSIGALLEGRLVYDLILRSKLELEIDMLNHLVEMYVNCRSLEEARKALTTWPKRDIVSWGILLAGYAECKDGHAALQVLEKLQEDGLKPDRVVFMSVLQACSNTENADQGKLVHDLLIRDGVNLDVMVGSTLVDMYAKSENLDEACNVHKSLPYRDAISWGILISAYSQHGYPHLALECFEKMLKDGVEPDDHLFSCTLKSCGLAGALQKGRSLHIQIIKRGLKVDSVVGSSLIDMYAKCGSLVEGWETLDYLHSPDVVSWNALIAGYAQQCEYTLAQECLQVMQAQGLKPDSTTYVSILAACSHAGKVQDGHWYFKFMTRDHITPNVEHLNCMIDLLSRAGHLNDAERMLKSTPILANATGWTSMLAACRRFGNPNLARECFDQIMQLDPDNAASFILMSSIYADFGMWEHLDELYKLKGGTCKKRISQKDFIGCSGSG